MIDFTINGTLSAEFASQIFAADIKKCIENNSEEYKKFITEYEKITADGR